MSPAAIGATAVGGMALGGTLLGGAAIGATLAALAGTPLGAIAGAEPLLTQQGAGTVTTAALGPLEDRTLYVVFNRLLPTAGWSGVLQFATMALAATESMALRSDGATSRVACRPQFTGGAGSGGALAFDTGSGTTVAVGKHVVALRTSGNLTGLALQVDTAADVTRSYVTGATGTGSGIAQPGITLTATAADSPVVGYLFRGAHSRATSDAVRAYLAAA